jgi:RNA polymerase sigma factor (TIGR02999 family)
MRRERPDHTLQPTAVVHEAYLRMIDISRIDWQGKTHFFAMAARQMRRVLIEHARKAGAKKRGARPQRITLKDDVALARDRTVDLLALQEALEKLARRNRRHAQVAELRLFAGLSEKEMAYALGVSDRTVREAWRVARAWLARELSSAGKGSCGH